MINLFTIDEQRPRLFHIHNGSGITIENIYFKDSPYWTVFLEDVSDVYIHHCNVTNVNTPDGLPYQGFHTDGFDIAGINVYMHDVEIINGACITLFILLNVDC